MVSYKSSSNFIFCRLDTKKNITLQGNKDLKDFLLLNAFSCVAPGIAQGKAGVALTLFMLARRQRDERLEEQAFDLLQQALVYSGKNIHFSVGSAGIGFVLLYLIRYHFIDADFYEIFDEQHRHILKTICSGQWKLKGMQEYAELLMYLDWSAGYVPGTDLRQAEEILMKRLQDYYQEIRRKQEGYFNSEEFCRCSSLLLTIYRGVEAGKEWWEKVEACCCSWQERSVVVDSIELGYKLMRYGRFHAVKDAEELGYRMLCRTLENKFPEIMSLREQTNLLFFFAQDRELRSMPVACKLKERIAERLVYAGKKRLEEQIVHSAWHYAFYCGLEGGVARLLLLRSYWDMLESGGQFPELECIFY